jgi:hypothetical protein
MKSSLSYDCLNKSNQSHLGFTLTIALVNDNLQLLDLGLFAKQG